MNRATNRKQQTMQPDGRAVVVSTTIERSPAEVWADVRDIASHVDWMQDAVERSSCPGAERQVRRPGELRR